MLHLEVYTVAAYRLPVNIKLHVRLQNTVCHNVLAMPLLHVSVLFVGGNFQVNHKNNAN